MIVSTRRGPRCIPPAKLAAEEFPDYDVNLRSAVSIARRLQDPLAELVKIDPKAIGVGQYQHDMPAKAAGRGAGRRGGGLRQRCGRGSEHGLRRPCCASVSGLNAATAKNIVALP